VAQPVTVAGSQPIKLRSNLAGSMNGSRKPASSMPKSVVIVIVLVQNTNPAQATVSGNGGRLLCIKRIQKVRVNLQNKAW
jgi:hypothetical protein